MNKLEEMKASFIERNKIYFDEGLLKMVFWTETYCICNLVNYEYLFFPYEYVKNGVQGGFEMQPEAFKKILKINQSRFFSMIHRYPVRFTADSEKYSVLLDQQTYVAMKKIKPIYDAEPNPAIDFDLEERVIKSLEGGGLKI